MNTRNTGLLVVLLGVVAVVVVILGIGRISVEEDKPPTYYEFGTTIVYEGRSLEISRIVECITPNTTQRTFPATGRSREAMAEKLYDGSGLIIVIPNLCDAEAWPVSPSYVPLILWTEDPDDPQVLEGYLAEDLLRSGAARVTLKGVFAKLSSKERFGDASRDFTQFSFSGNHGAFRKFSTAGMRFVGLTARPIARDVWAQVPELAGILPTLDAAKIIPSNLFKSIETHFPFRFGLDALEPNPSDNWPRSAPDRRDALSHAMPLRWSDGAFHIDNQSEGIGFIYPVDKVPTLNMIASDQNSPGVTNIVPRSKGAATGPEWPLWTGKAVIEIGAGAIYFDPASQQIIPTQEIGFYLFQK
ncbi:MAG: hypothetical protein HYU58_05070 [Proteobacteria bacterium]|nr:hypothetical protein [Pseudomonadota bacterium]